jgi:hypothetical protein
LDILHLIDRLESLLGSGQHLRPFGRVMVNEQDILNIIDQMRVSIPEDMREAQKIVRERDRLLEEARAEGVRAAERAEAEVQAKLSETTFVQLAEQRAREIEADARGQAASIVAEARSEVERILQNAEADANERRSGADEYALDVLRRLDSQLTSFLTSVRRGVEALEMERDERQSGYRRAQSAAESRLTDYP